MLPVKLNTSPTAPVPPEPVEVIETVKSFSVKSANVSFTPAEKVPTPSPVSDLISCFLNVYVVSEALLFAVVFNVLIFSYGNLNIEIFFSGDWVFALLLVAIVFVDTSLPPTAADNVNVLEDKIASTILVREVPPSVVNDIESPTFNSSVNLVLKPVIAVPLFATDNVPVNVKFSPFVASNAVSAVNVGEPAIAICLTCGISNAVTPFKPTASAWITAVLLDVPPVIVSPATKSPCTFDTTTTPCAAVPPEV